MAKRFITHIVTVPGLGIPIEGQLKKLYFYTRIEGTPGKWYFGTGNNSYSEQEMRGKIDRRKVLALPQEVKLAENRGLWFNNKGEVFYAPLVRRYGIFNKRLVFTNSDLLELCK